MDLDQIADTPPKRGPGRPPKTDARANELRPVADERTYDRNVELARAEAAAREIREQLDGYDPQAGDEFHIPAEWIPPGWSYEWKRVSVAGKPDDENFRVAHYSGWRAVPASRHPQLVSVGFDGQEIIKKGLMLMERPKVITDEARRRESRDAQAAVSDNWKSIGLASKTLKGPNDADVAMPPRLERSYHPHHSDIPQE